MAAKPTLLIDMDGCLVDMLPSWLRELGLPPYMPVNCWDVHEAVGMPAEKVYEALNGFSEHWWAGLPHMPGAPIIWTRLSDVYRCVVCTSPAGPQSVVGKRRWVLQHLGLRAAQGMVFSRAKHLIPGAVIIDDKPNTLMTCAAAGKTTVKFAHSYNQDTPADITVSRWADVERALITRTATFGAAS